MRRTGLRRLSVIDTTLMNVPISALVDDLNAAAGAVQAAITL